MKKIDVEKFIDNLIDSHLNSAKILLRKIKNDEDFHINDFEVMKIILEDYIARLENIICR